MTDFHRAAGMRDGHRNECKPCFLEIARARYAADPEKAKAQVKRWQQANGERVSAQQRERRKRPEVKRQARDASYRKTYGISADEFDAILELQAGRCYLREGGFLELLQAM